MLRQMRPALVILGVFTLLLGLAYPLTVTGLAQALFSRQANGSLVMDGADVAGSELIGQPFADPKYFWGRLSATPGFPYNASASSGSNYGPSNPALIEAVQARIDALRSVDPGNDAPIPVDLVTASASGLDPHISPAAAYYQAERVARYRGVPIDDIRQLVENNTAGRQFGFLGEPRVNVLALNRALDDLTKSG
jgi:potassium-transporting ATPase KdpC subunit